MLYIPINNILNTVASFDIVYSFVHKTFGVASFAADYGSVIGYEELVTLLRFIFHRYA